MRMEVVSNKGILSVHTPEEMFLIDVEIITMICHWLIWTCNL